MMDADFFMRFGIHAIALIALLKYTFFRYSFERDALFSFTLFGHGVFIVAGLLHNVDISMGFAFGLFAIFSMLRYRTESISVRNMTYLFLVIVISLISSVGPLSLLELALANALICTLTWGCETRLLAERHSERAISYGNLKYLKPQHRKKLLRDLRECTGLMVKEVKIVEVNYKSETAKLHIFYDDSQTPSKKLKSPKQSRNQMVR